MESVIINTKTKSDLQLLLELVKKMGFRFKIITDEEKEDIGLLKAMEEGKKSKLVSRAVIMNKLKKNAK